MVQTNPGRVKPTFDQIKQEAPHIEGRFQSSDSPYAQKIRSILTEFDSFADDYKSLWNEFLTNGIQTNVDSRASTAIEERIADLWIALKLIVNQYNDPKYQSKIQEGMTYLENLAAAHPDIFPAEQPIPDVLIFIKGEEVDVNIARKYPYTNTFFIGISTFSVNLTNDTNKEDDWTPIAHELGHYIYWNSRFDTKIAENDAEPLFTKEIETVLRENLSQSLDDSTRESIIALMISWSEEMFADLVGITLLGRDFVKSSQDVFLGQQEQQASVRFINDVEHPIPYLRPFVCAEGLKLKEGRINRLWSGFKDMLGSSFKEPTALNVGLFETDKPNESGILDISLDIPTTQKAIKLTLPILYEKLIPRYVLTDRVKGIDFIKQQINNGFADFYIESSEVLEKGDKPGFVRKIRRKAKKLIDILLGR